ncbi:hypothetical protein BDZ90DRAFT_232219 [Jaminaea rosea]|uniref:DUF829-domain-containing protein n=1 Tax=Jaminaea rosea TaxID=1569628 RepID=A0A316US73_9BASI|nr:hypothetical protein BDZ90DRAFT_232219 [Jaminaea rosea]PWN27834.1 hypothetical protein BDZ90DRAFT_232219 [Jaminaea rosea]
MATTSQPQQQAASSSNKDDASSSSPFILNPLTPSLHIYRPQPQPKNAKPPSGALTLTSPTAPPRIILIFGWMNAPLRLVQKYAQPYSTLFPSATVLVLLSTSKGYFRDHDGSIAKLCSVLGEEAGRMEGREKMRAEMRKVEGKKEDITLDGDVRATVAEAGEEKPKPLAPAPRGMIIHSFSDGGASNLCTLLDQLKRSSTVTAGLAEHLATRALVLDSSPSLGSAWTGSDAFTLPLGNPATQPWLVRHVVRRLARAVIYVVMLLARFWVTKVRGRKTRARRVREGLNAPTSWELDDGTEKEGKKVEGVPPRLYLYSQSDALVPWRDVEAHARELDPSIEPIDAEGGGSSEEKSAESSSKDGTEPDAVRLVRWRNAQHCAIVRHDPEGYWKQVEAWLKETLR